MPVSKGSPALIRSVFFSDIRSGLVVCVYMGPHHSFDLYFYSRHRNDPVLTSIPVSKGIPIAHSITIFIRLFIMLPTLSFDHYFYSSTRGVSVLTSIPTSKAPPQHSFDHYFYSDIRSCLTGRSYGCAWVPQNSFDHCFYS